jgi:hypothetical protein
MTASPQRVERPDHARRTDVERLQRQRLLPPLPFVGGPEPVGVERRVGVGDDRRDRVGDARGLPRLAGQWIELRRLVEHGVSVRAVRLRNEDELALRRRAFEQLVRAARLGERQALRDGGMDLAATQEVE